ncbi:MAG: hypothetical protein IPG06_20930, partial [Haliea sp.]|nr:hypothetical protein [Haliea sp.]
LQKSLSKSDDEKTSPSLPNISFTQSDIVEFEMGDNSYLAFIQPTDLTIDNEPMVLMGLVPESDYRVNKYSIDLLTFTYISLVIIGLSALIPIVRLYLLHSEAILRPGDWVQLALAVPLIATVVLVLINTILAQRGFESGFDNRLKDIAYNMSANFQKEAEGKFNGLHSLTTTEKYEHYEECTHPGDTRAGEAVAQQRVSDVKGRGPQTDFGSLNSYRSGFSSIFEVDEEGKRTGECRSALLYPSIKPDGAQGDFTRTDLSQREYVKRILQRSGFYDYSSTRSPRGYIERVESIVDGVLETAFSVKHPESSNVHSAAQNSTTEDTDGMLPSVAIGLSTIQSFESAILPFGYQYAVIDRTSGDVIFHSEDAKSLREIISGG